VAKAQMELAEVHARVQIAHEQLAAAKHETLACARLLLPHRRFHIPVYNDGVSWIAEFKCPEGEPLVGRGDSPALALNDFDEQWLGLK
jgi:hypothetical protein